MAVHLLTRAAAATGSTNLSPPAERTGGLLAGPVVLTTAIEGEQARLLAIPPRNGGRPAQGGTSGARQRSAGRGGGAWRRTAALRTAAPARPQHRARARRLLQVSALLARLSPRRDRSSGRVEKDRELISEVSVCSAAERLVTAAREAVRELPLKRVRSTASTSVSAGLRVGQGAGHMAERWVHDRSSNASARLACAAQSRI
jgi:hypothetical protein